MRIIQPLSSNLKKKKKNVTCSKNAINIANKKSKYKSFFPHSVCFSQIIKGIINPQNQFFMQNKCYIIFINLSSPISIFKTPQ